MGICEWDVTVTIDSYLIGPQWLRTKEADRSCPLHMTIISQPPFSFNYHHGYVHNYSVLWHALQMRCYVTCAVEREQRYLAAGGDVRYHNAAL